MGLFSKKFNPYTDLSDLSGKVVIVTGGDGGLGYATVLHLARCGAKVYIAARSEEKMTAALERLESDDTGPGNGEVQLLTLDLSDPRQVKAVAEEFLTLEDRLDILINNAAWLTGSYEKSVDGVVDSMMINHVGPFVFTQALLPLMKQTAKEPSADVRIVNISSAEHRIISPEDARFGCLDDFNQEFAKSALPQYSRYAYSKLANILWTKELQRRIDSEDALIIAISLHPGNPNTSADNLPSIWRTIGNFIIKLLLRPAHERAYTSVIAAAHPKVREKPDVYKGAYLEPVGKIATPSKAARNPELSKELWSTTETFLKSIGLTFDA